MPKPRIPALSDAWKMLAFAVPLMYSAIASAAQVELEDMIIEESPDGQYRARKASIAGKTPLKLREIPESVSVMTRSQMDDQGMTEMQEAMRQTTGINVIANDTLSQQYLSRGYSMGVMYDGIPSYNGMTPSHHFDLALYERLEVLRGPAGLWRGSGEPGGVVNLVKKKPKKAFALSWKTAAGSWDNYRGEVDVTGPLTANERLRGRLVAASQDRHYFYDHTNSEKQVGMASLVYELDAASQISLSYSQQTQEAVAPWSGLPTSSTTDAHGHFRLLDVSRSTFHVPDWGRLKYDTREWAATLEHRWSNGWNAKLAFNDRRRNQYYKYAYSCCDGLDPNTQRLDYSSFRGDSDNTRQGADLYIQGPFELLGRTHSLTLGANAERYRTKRKSGNGPDYNDVLFEEAENIPEPTISYTSGRKTETDQHGLYSQLRLSLSEPLTLTLGARSTDFRNRQRNVAPSTRTAWKDGAKKSAEVTPYAGLVYDLDRHVTLYASYTDIFVPQTQLRADGGTLDPRIGRQYEIGSKTAWLNDRLALSLAWFDIQDENRAVADPDFPNDNYYLNAGKVRSRGWEVEVTGSPAPGLELSAGYTRLVTRYLEDDANEKRTYSIQTPKHQLKLWGEYRFSGPRLKGLIVGLGMIANSEAQSSRGWRDEVVNSGYAVVNGRLAYRLDKHYTVGLNANNLLDRKYYASVGTPNIYNFYGEPRNVLLTLSARY